jgi:hypothetical protein
MLNKIGDFLYLGDEKKRMNIAIKEGFEKDPIPGRPTTRVPRHVVEDQIDNNSAPSIGGDIQLGIANIFGYQPYAIMKPRVTGEPEAYTSYLGRELTPDIMLIGNSMVGGLSM